ncbi:bifunctional (p)ppGpp synthetase/guanosine-3',5'-bis(diphosphate) 3'-pyrophosphohydrolase [Candidatus Uhrbacteria bacterium]|nr:bifunctional (p)ppGpp synthetase/guanosine-3',5'-bis(diphosphate) 3'-pyrophosphohydrolase [Candidatus Uhrbacteria bacterium]
MPHIRSPYPSLPIRALEQAAIWHDGQIRRHPELKIPYIAHPAGVGLMLERAGCDEETIAAGILHDVIEDCGVTADEIMFLFGSRVALLVKAVSEPAKTVPWRERKAAYVAQLRAAPVEAIAIATADHLYNMNSLLTSLRASSDAWNMFHSDKDEKIRVEKQVYEIARTRWVHPLVEAFASVIQEVVRLSSGKSL